MTMQHMPVINEEKNVFDDHLLDVIGNEFKFSHEKGLSEWLKNSVDAYLREKTDDSVSHIVFRFTESVEITFECIDFVGMTSDRINKALKRWGDPEAARSGTTRKTFGGHGNGGKFYMRQMFRESHFITYRKGKLNVFGFNEHRKYGFAKGFKDKEMTPQQALKFAGINSLPFPPGVKEAILNSKTGFTITCGIHPSQLKRRFNTDKLCDKFRHHPQARIILKHKPVMVIHNGEVFVRRLIPESIPPMSGFETPLDIKVPETLAWEDHGESETVILAAPNYPPGTLKLYTSADPLSRNSRLADLNCIDIIGDIGVIASYHIHELGFVRLLSSAEFIYGECNCTILEDPTDDCVTNDRTKLVENIKTKALRKWISQQVDALARKIEEKDKKELEEKNVENLSDINKLLNSWKNSFMSKTIREIIGGVGDGAGAGIGTGGVGLPQGSDKAHTQKSGRTAKADNITGGGSERQKKQSFPLVLLSSYDDDPLNPGQKFHLLDRQGPVYQRPLDVEQGIYWINTSRKLARYIIDTYGVKSLKWRDYHLQRIIDVICKETLYRLEKQDPENFTASRVDSEIFTTLLGRAHDSAVDSLQEYLFGSDFKTPQEERLAILNTIPKLRSLPADERKQFLNEIEEAIALHKTSEE